MSKAESKRLGIIDYGMGNLSSVTKMALRTGAEVRVISNSSELAWADRLVLPGVGAFPDAMTELARRDLIHPLKKAVFEDKKPILGICLGMELMAKSSDEIRPTEGLGWLNAQIVPFDRASGIRVPHVGWNQISVRQKSPLLEGVAEGSFFYFVHSYHMVCEDKSQVAATTSYGGEVVAAVHRDNIYGAQFHPEKSQASGFIVFMNFVNGVAG